MKYYILLNNNIVGEVIPEINPTFPGVPIVDRYSPEFIAQLMEWPEAVKPGLFYDKLTNTFIDPPETDVTEFNPDATPAEIRKYIYATRRVVEWEDSKLTIDEANQKYLYYLAEGDTEKASALQTMIHEQKEIIRSETSEV